jgi:hypothetical protein
MGWRENGKRLREQILSTVHKEKIAPRGTSLPVIIPGPEVDLGLLRAAVRSEFYNERDALVKHLCERPIGPAEQLALAQILAKPSRKGGRPREATAVTAALAETLFGEWCRMNKASGAADRGHRAEMRRMSATLAVQLSYYGKPEFPSDETIEQDVTKVIEVMRRPGHRRISLDEAILVAAESEAAQCRQPKVIDAIHVWMTPKPPKK